MLAISLGGHTNLGFCLSHSLRESSACRDRDSKPENTLLTGGSTHPTPQLVAVGERSLHYRILLAPDLCPL